MVDKGTTDRLVFILRMKRVFTDRFDYALNKVTLGRQIVPKTFVLEFIVIFLTPA